MRQPKESLMRVVFLFCACTSILAVVLICIFLFAGGLPAMQEIGIGNFLLGLRWKPTNGLYGIFPMIVGKLVGGVTAVAVAMLITRKYKEERHG